MEQNTGKEHDMLLNIWQRGDRIPGCRIESVRYVPKTDFTQDPQYAIDISVLGHGKIYEPETKQRRDAGPNEPGIKTMWCKASYIGKETLYYALISAATDNCIHAQNSKVDVTQLIGKEVVGYWGDTKKINQKTKEPIFSFLWFESAKTPAPPEKKIQAVPVPTTTTAPPAQPRAPDVPATTPSAPAPKATIVCMSCGTDKDLKILSSGKAICKACIALLGTPGATEPVTTVQVPTKTPATPEGKGGETLKPSAVIKAAAKEAMKKAPAKALKTLYCPMKNDTVALQDNAANREFLLTNGIDVEEDEYKQVIYVPTPAMETFKAQGLVLVEDTGLYSGATSRNRKPIRT